MTSLRSGGSSLMLQRTWTPKSNVPRVAVCCFQLTWQWQNEIQLMAEILQHLERTNTAWVEFRVIDMICFRFQFFETCHSENKLAAILVKLVETDWIFARRDKWLLSTRWELEACMSSLKFSVVGTHHLPRVRLSNHTKCQVWCEKLRSLKEWGEVENVYHVDFDIFKPIGSLFPTPNVGPNSLTAQPAPESPAWIQHVPRLLSSKVPQSWLQCLL